MTELELFVHHMKDVTKENGEWLHQNPFSIEDDTPEFDGHYTYKVWDEGFESGMETINLSNNWVAQQKKLKPNPYSHPILKLIWEDGAKHGRLQAIQNL